MTETDNSCFACGGQFQKQLDVKDHFLSQEMFEVHCCSSCNLRRTFPVPDPGEIGKYYETDDYLSHGDDQKGLFAWLYRVAKKYNLSKKGRILKQHACGKDLLDYGCGTGDFILYCQGLDYKVRGAEPSSNALEHASSIILDNITDPQQELESGRSYDVITMWHVLEHIHEPDQILAQLKGKLKKNGKLIIAVPNPVSLDAAHYGDNWAGWDVPRHLWHFEPSAMREMMKGLGFYHIDTMPMWFDAFYVSMLSERYKNGLVPKALFWGFVSNLNALFAKKRSCSSQIYVFEAQ